MVALLPGDIRQLKTDSLTRRTAIHDSPERLFAMLLIAWKSIERSADGTEGAGHYHSPPTALIGSEPTPILPFPQKCSVVWGILVGHFCATTHTDAHVAPTTHYETSNQFVKHSNQFMQHDYSLSLSQGKKVNLSLSKILLARGQSLRV